MKFLYNANIHTLNESQPKASAMLIAGGRIIAVGEKNALESLAHGKVEKQDMKGKTILPGLTDAHIHIQHYALFLGKIDCETKTKAECLRRVAERVKKAKPGEWVLGHGWNHNEWFSSPSGRGQGEGGELPTADELDVLTPNNPVYLTANDQLGGTGVAHTYYRILNGSNPELTVYTSSFNIPLGAELQFFSDDRVGNTEIIQTVQIALQCAWHWSPIRFLPPIYKPGLSKNQPSHGV